MPAELKITLLARTSFEHIEALKATSGWSASGSGVTGSSALVEAAGRACYQSWHKPNPATADNPDYIRHILEVEHFSVLRHGSISVYVEGVSRSFSLELIRHHVGTAVSQLSQRYVDAEDMDYVIPPAMRGNRRQEDRLARNWDLALLDYADTVRELDPDGKNRKKAREAARAFLPGCTETKMVFTGNHEAWRNIIAQRGGAAADAEIREFAVAMAKLLKNLEPAIYQDLVLDTLPDGREVAVF